MNLNDWLAAGKPLNSVVCCDCLEGMKHIADKSVDLVLTSPPYNIGNNHHTNTIKHSAYNDELPENEYQEQQIKILSELYRALKNEGSILYNHKNRLVDGVSLSPYQWLTKTKLLVKQELVWFNGSPNFDKIRFYPMTERIYWLVKSKDTVLKNTISHHDVFYWNAVGTSGEHTRAFPEEMAFDLFRCFTESQIILDPFGGSGTTGVAAKMLGRNYILFEKEQRYVDIALKRLEHTQGMAEGLKRWTNK